MKLKIKDLQNFTKQYFPYKCPIVRWKIMKGCFGQADIGKNIIYLNPNQLSEKKFGCGVEEGIYKPKTKIRFRDGEQYFATLLHEIAEFKFFRKSKPPKYFESIKKKVVKGLKESKIKPTLDNMAYSAENYFKNYDNYFEFRSWLGGRLMSEHIKVENWAIREFKKQRKRIKKILNY